MQICAHNPLRSTSLLLALLAALVLAACGDDDSGGSAGPDPATVTPAGVPFYADAVVRPEGDQQEGVNEALGKLTGEEDPGAFIRSLLEAELEEEGVSYSEDIEPWLGSTAGGFITELSPDGESAEGAVAIAFTDEGAAQDAIDKLVESSDDPAEEQTYEGVAYKSDGEGAAGIVGDFLVAGTRSGFEGAVDASNGDSLADDGAVSEALDSSVEESLFRAYVEGASLVELTTASGVLDKRDLKSIPEDQLAALEEGPIVFSGALTADDATFEASGPAMEAGGSGAGELVSSLPSGAWLAFGVPMLGDAIEAGYESFLKGFEAGFEAAGPSELFGGQAPDIDAEVRDATGLDIARDFRWAGDVALFIQGTSLFELGAGLVIETADQQAATDAVEKLRSTLSKERSLRISETPDGFQISSQDAPVGAEVAVTDGKVVVAGAGTTVDDVLSPAETLADSEGFGTASDVLGDGLDPAFYLDFGTIASLVESTGQAGADPLLGQALAALDSLTYLIAGQGTEEDRSVGRAVLGIGEGGGSSSGEAAAITP